MRTLIRPAVCACQVIFCCRPVEDLTVDERARESLAEKHESFPLGGWQATRNKAVNLAGPKRNRQAAWFGGRCTLPVARQRRPSAGMIAPPMFAMFKSGRG